MPRNIRRSPQNRQAIHKAKQLRLDPFIPHHKFHQRIKPSPSPNAGENLLANGLDSWFELLTCDGHAAGLLAGKR
jgi:hypothetical protein